MARAIHLARGRIHAYLHPRLTALERVGEATMKWDLEGRPVSGQWENVYYRRGISHAVMARSRLERAGRILPGGEAAAALDHFHRLAKEAGGALSGFEGEEGAELRGRLAGIRAAGPEALERDAARFRAVYRPVPILPPDRVLSFVVQATEGCSWNRCSFCGLYPDREFRVRDEEDVERHLRGALDLFGRSILLRRGLFLGDGDPFAVPDERLLPVVDRILAILAERERKGGPLPRSREIFAFARLRSLTAGGGRDLRPYSARGFRRLYVGIETGDEELYRLLRKPGSLASLPEARGRMAEAGIAAGLIFLVGVGGERYRDAHREGCVRLLAPLDLGPDDLVFLSPFRTVPGTDYAAWAEREGIRPMGREEMHDEAREMALALHRAGVRAKAAYYPLEHFVY
ncbi:MAG: radical SAM protein [Candidatus Eisenbacteria bacterium]